MKTIYQLVIDNNDREISKEFTIKKLAMCEWEKSTKNSQIFRSRLFQYSPSYSDPTIRVVVILADHMAD
jgi:hypothetical protein